MAETKISVPIFKGNFFGGIGISDFCFMRMGKAALAMKRGRDFLVLGKDNGP